MALSGSFSTSVSGGHYTLRVDWSASQSIANNTSTITVNAYLVNDWSLSVGGRSGNTLNVAGVSGTYSTSAIKTTGTHLLTTYTSSPITHNADGSKSVNISVSWKMNATINGTYYGTMTASDTVALDTIARASQPSLITYPDNTQDVGEFGETISIHMNRKSSAFTHKVRYAFGSLSGTCMDADTGKAATAVGTGFRWTIPLSFMNEIPNDTKGSGRIYVDTYNGSTLVGTKYSGFTARVPDDVKPTVSCVLEDISSAGGHFGSPVQGLSKIKVTVSATPAYGSPIKNTHVIIDGVKYYGGTVTSAILTKAGTSRVSVGVNDGRSRLTTWQYDMNVLPYTPPAITKLSVHRCDEDGTENEGGDYAKVTFSAAVTPLNNKNTSSYTIAYKKSTETSWKKYSPIDYSNQFTVTDATYIFDASGDSSYDVQVTASDRQKVTTRNTSVSTGFTLMNWNAKGNGMGIGKISEKENTMEIALDVEFLGAVRGAIFDAIYPVGSIYLAFNHTDPSSLFGGTWVRMANTFLWGCDASGTIGQTGGEKTHTLTVNEIPAHTHGSVYSQHASGTKDKAWYNTSGSSVAYGAVSTGGGEAHNNMPPYTQVSIWRRTA